VDGKLVSRSRRSFSQRALRPGAGLCAARGRLARASSRKPAGLVGPRNRPDARLACRGRDRLALMRPWARFLARASPGWDVPRLASIRTMSDRDDRHSGHSLRE
jgi:hypothetical protein